MSRELSFRAWTGQTMMYQDQQYLGSFLRRVVLQIMLEHGSDEPREHESYLPKGTTIDDYLMEFIGREDRNGKKIYEGDVVEYLDNTSQGLVKKTVIIEDIRHLPDFSCSKWQEVIGNIHENSDLLTV